MTTIFDIRIVALPIGSLVQDSSGEIVFDRNTGEDCLPLRCAYAFNTAEEVNAALDKLNQPVKQTAIPD